MNCSPADLENRPPTIIPDSGVPGCAVARSDLQQSLEVIHAYFGACKESARDDGPGGVSASVRRRLCSAAHESIVFNVTHTAQPTDDETFARITSEVYAQEEFQRPDLGDMLADALSDSDDDDDEEDSLQEYEDEDFLDQDVLKRARSLREKLRQSAKRELELRDSVLDLARDVCKDNLQLQALVEGLPAEDKRPIIPNLDDLEDNTAVEAVTKALESLRKVMDEDDLPGRVEKSVKSFGNTIEVVRKETDDDRVLSQTEQAIQSRTNDGSQSVSEEAEEEGNVDPEDALIRFLYS